LINPLVGLLTGQIGGVSLAGDGVGHVSDVAV